MRLRFVAYIGVIVLVSLIGLQNSSALDFTNSPNVEKNYYFPEHNVTKSDTAVVYPIFTQAAYGNDGFYDYYKKNCDSRCLTVRIPSQIYGSYVSSGQGFIMLNSLHFDILTDVDVDKHPSLLKHYKRVIILHNEYVTKKEFSAITKHPDVLYLYPNSLYAQVKVDYVKNQITLVRGHGYPISNIGNGFGWIYDNSNMEYNTSCKNSFYLKASNGLMLNCYPELVISDKPFLKSLLQ